MLESLRSRYWQGKFHSGISWLIGSCHLTLCSHDLIFCVCMEKEIERNIRKVHMYMCKLSVPKGPIFNTSSNSNYHPKAQSSDTIILGARSLKYEFWQHKHSVHNTYFMRLLENQIIANIYWIMFFASTYSKYLYFIGKLLIEI